MTRLINRILLGIAVQLPVEKKSDALLQHATLQWAASDPEAAAHWAQEFPEGALAETDAENIIKLWPASSSD